MTSSDPSELGPDPGPGPGPGLGPDPGPGPGADAGRGSGPGSTPPASPGTAPYPAPGSGPGTAAAGPYGQTARRLSPRVLLIDPIRLLPSLALPLLGVLIAGGFSRTSFGWAATAVVVSTVYAVVRWATFTYHLTEERLELTRAFIGRSVKTIPLERIRGVDITEPPLHRLLGLAVLKIDTGATGKEQEGTLDAVTMEEARALRTALLTWRPAPSTPPEAAGSGAAPPVGSPTHAAAEHAGVGHGVAQPGVAAGIGPETAGRVLARVPRRWLGFGPLSGAYLLTPFALVAGAIGLIVQWGEELGLDERAVRQAVEWLWARPYLLIAAAVLLVTAMPIAGAVAYAIFNWDFTLRAREGYLVAERGLITRRTVSLERRRIRGYELTEALLERWAGVTRVWAVVTGLGDAATRGQLLPVTPKAYAVRIAGEAIGPFAVPLRPHPPQALRRRLVRAVVPWVAVAVTAFALDWAVLGGVALGLAVVGVPLGIDRYRSLGHAYDGAWLSVRSGSLRRTQAVVERRAVVGWTLRQTLFQRLAGLITVTVGVGAGSGGYPAIDAGEQQGVAFAAEVTPDWLRPFMTEPPSPPAGPGD